jgi:hypothetical protein
MRKLWERVKAHFIYHTYLLQGYRWHELRLTRKRHWTWCTFRRPYSIAQTQAVIERDVQWALLDGKHDRISESELRRRFSNEETYIVG